MRAAARRIVRELSTATFKLSPTDDPLGAEYWGAFKNVIALACGVSDGLRDGGFGGDNLKAAIFTAGYQEAVRLLSRTWCFTGNRAVLCCRWRPIRHRDVTIWTKSSNGERLGRGQTLEQAQNEMVMVSEGVRAARMFQRLYRNGGLSAPFVDAVCAFVRRRDVSRRVGRLRACRTLSGGWRYLSLYRLIATLTTLWVE